MLQQFGHHAYTILSVEKLKATQRHTARFVVSDYDYSSSSISSILNQRNWPGLAMLATRRQVSRLLIAYKIVHQDVALELPNGIVLFNTITRTHDMKYCALFCRIDVHKIVSFRLKSNCGSVYLRILFILITVTFS